MNTLTVKDRIYGALYGCAIGDALGLASEFMSKGEVAMRYPNGVHDYSDIVRDAHRSQWEPGEWTNDTEVNLRLIDTIIDDNDYDIRSIARKLKDWYDEGHPDMVPAYRFIFKHPDFLTNPIQVAADVWSEVGRFEASNEALTRAPFTGMSGSHYLERSAEICAITHSDSRCLGASMVIGRMAHDLMWHRRVTDEATLTKISSSVDDRIIPYIRWAQHPTLDPLDLDDDDTLWFVRKSMAAALWCIWHDLTAEQALEAIIREGGDADTNGAVTLSLIGLRDGYNALPERLRDGLKDRKRLDQTADKMVDYFIRYEHHGDNH